MADIGNDLRVGFFRFDAYTNPNPNIGGCAPGPGNFKVVMLGGPRSVEDVKAEITACEQTLERLRAELAELGKSGEQK